MSSRPYDAIVAGRTAAFAHGAGDFLVSPYTFAVTRRKQTSRGDMLYLKREIDERDVVFVASLPVTSFERTVHDLVELREDPDLVDKFIQDASRGAGHQFDLGRLAELLAPLAMRNGFGKMDGIKIDLVVSQVPSGVADTVVPASRLDVKGLPTFDYRVYPVVNAMADKVCAIMQSYSGGRPSSRVRDLVDLVIYITTEAFDGGGLGAQIALEARLRKMGDVDAFRVPNRGMRYGL